MTPSAANRLGCWLLVGMIVLAERTQAGDRPADLPPLNARVAKFARAHLGEPVGDGICITLAVEALRDAGGKQFPLTDRSGDYIWGDLVPDLRTVLPGDILQFRDAVFSGSRYAGQHRRESWRDTYPHHTAIVAGTAENGRLISIYHQNVAVRGDDPDKIGQVRTALLRMNSLQKGGQIRAYRPVPASLATDPDRRAIDP